MKRRLKFLTLLLLCVCPSLAAQERELGEEVEFLCSEQRGGRAFGSPQAQDVTFYLLRQFRNAGLRASVQSFSYGGKAGHNVVGVTKGWFRRYVVVSAYYDGFGVLDGELYPGADSNASGVAVLLSLVRSLPVFCDGDTGLIFAAFDAHNAGMNGSKEFLEAFRGEYDIVQAVNLDILGSSLVPVHSGRRDYLIALGAGTHRLSIDSANRDFGLDIAYDYYGSEAFTDLFYRKIGDQRWFLEAGIPSVMFTSGITMNTNKSTDTPDCLDMPVLGARASFIKKWLLSFL